MVENADSLVYKNVSLWRGFETLYLDTRTADVFFLFETEGDEPEKVPAHKNILSVSSPVFDAMFYGEMKEKGDVKIIDTPPNAFKEFLQFFYLSTLKITPEYIPDVMNLGKQYMISKCFSACSEFSEATFTLDTICMGYELAILFEDDGLKKYCEGEICENAEEVFDSSSFLECGPNVLRRILLLDHLNCNEPVVFDGCMAWAKTACTRKGIDEENAHNMRSQLGDLFYEIRFGEMSVDDFYARHQQYEDMFTKEEFKCIMGMIASKEFPSGKFNRTPRTIKNAADELLENVGELVCNRVDPAESYSTHCYSKSWRGLDRTAFASNQWLLLKKIFFKVQFQPKNELIVTIKVVAIDIVGGDYEDEGAWCHDDERLKYNCIQCTKLVVNHNPEIESIWALSPPIVIKANVTYGIIFESEFGVGNFLAHKKRVEMGRGAVITFFDMKEEFCGEDLVVIEHKYGLLTQLHFEKYNPKV